MARFICFANQKGGVGKTTLTALCANALSSPPFNHSVCVVDADRQKSFSKARSIDAQITSKIPYKVVEMTSGEVVANVDSLEEFDFVFVDVQGKIDEGLSIKQQDNTKILLLSDFIFIPFVSGSFGTDASIDFLKHLLTLREVKPSLMVFGVFNMFQARAKESKALLDEMKVISRVFNIDFLKAPLSNLSVYRNVDTVTSLYAKDNFKLFFDEFYKMIK
jgi:chromosome partitioning protein